LLLVGGPQVDAMYRFQKIETDNSAYPLVTMQQKICRYIAESMLSQRVIDRIAQASHDAYLHMNTSTVQQGRNKSLTDKKSQS
jgi:hypothetical protein